MNEGGGVIPARRDTAAHRTVGMELFKSASSSFEQEGLVVVTMEGRSSDGDLAEVEVKRGES